MSDFLPPNFLFSSVHTVHSYTKEFQVDMNKYWQNSQLQNSAINATGNTATFSATQNRYT